jgi:hypothetical protein
VDRENVQIMNLVPSQDLTPARESWLIEGLVAALPRLRMRELFRRRMDMFREADLLTVAVTERAGSVVGALSSRWVSLATGERFLHVTTQFVGDDYRHGAVFRPSWANHLATVQAGPWGFPAIIVLKTYNPLVFCAMRRISRIAGVGFYPSIDPETDRKNGAGATSTDHTNLASRIVRVISADHPFDPATGVISDAGVPRDLYPALPRSADPAVNDYFAEVTAPGDRILCMLQIPSQQAACTIMRFFGRTQAPH